MPKLGKYLVNPVKRRKKLRRKNPVPYGIIIANPTKMKRRAKKRRNPAAKKRRPGIFVIRKAKRNPMRKRRAKVRRAKRRNPMVLKHVLVENPHRKKSRRKKSRNRNPMSKSRKRRRSRSHSRSRNPVRRSKRRRSRSRMFRNPMGAITQVFTENVGVYALGGIAGNVVTTMIMNRLVAPPVGQMRPFDLPGVQYPGTGTVTAANFYSVNAIPLAVYRALIGGLGAYFLRNSSPRLATGIAIGTAMGVGNDVLRKTNIINAQGTLGMGRNFGAGRNGMGYLPGTNTRFTGPAQGFLVQNNNAPRPNRGMSAMVGPGMVRQTEAQAEGTFRGAN